MQQGDSSEGERSTSRIWTIRGGLVALVAVIAAAAVIAVCQFPLGDEPEREAERASGSARDREPEGTAPAATTALPNVPVAQTLPSGEAGRLDHPTGARIEVPAGAIRKDAVLTITEVEPPKSTLEVRRVFDFSVGDALLFQPVTLQIPYELEPGEKDAGIQAVHWNEELEVWEAVPSDVNADRQTVTVVAESLSFYGVVIIVRTVAALSSVLGSPSAEEAERPQVQPEIVSLKVGTGFPLVEDVATEGDNLIIEFVVRNSGQRPLSSFGENAAGQVFLTSPGVVQERPKLQSHVPWGLFGENLISTDHWQPGLSYNTQKYHRDDWGDSISHFLVPGIVAGRHVVRLELVFWDNEGNEIARDVVEKEIEVTLSPVIESTEVVVDGVVYRVETNRTAGGAVEYVVVSEQNSTPTRDTREKAIYTAALQQQAIRTKSWVNSAIAFGQGGTHESLPHLKVAFFALEEAGPILVIVLSPSPAHKASAGISIGVSVLEELLKRVSDHPEHVVYQTGLNMANDAQDNGEESWRIFTDTWNGQMLSFEQALEMQDGFRYHAVYWQPSARAVLKVTAPGYSVGEDSSELALTLAGSAAMALEVTGAIDVPLSNLIDGLQAAAVLAELDEALDEFEPWKTLKEEINHNLAVERASHSEFLDKLQITNHSLFELSSLSTLEIPHYSEYIVNGDAEATSGEAPVVTSTGTPTGAASAGDAASDRAALVALYNATGGRNWRNNGNWLSNAPMGEWHGVTTDSDGRVTKLSLSFNQLTGEIPAELGSLTKLTRLYLDGNQLTGAIPAELGNLANLEYLYLYDNQLTGAISAELGNLPSLQSLWLHNNQLTGAIPAELGNLPSLQSLWLFNNQLTGAIPAELGNLANLQTLYLFNNQLTGEIPAELGDLTNLRWLRLYDNQLTGEIPAELGNLANLQTLYLDGNQLTGEIPAELGDLTNLEGLDLRDNRLTGEIPAELGDLTNLTHLYLLNNQLTGEIPAELGSLTNLQSLWLRGNQLTGCIPEGLRNMHINDFGELGLPFCGS